jgi:hypothetical protein
MPKNKVVDVGGTRYMVRGLTFEELVKLGSASTEEKESRAVVSEVLSRCLIDPRLRHEDITRLDDKTLVALVIEVLDIAKNGLEDMGFVSMPPDRGLLRDMIV